MLLDDLDEIMAPLRENDEEADEEEEEEDAAKRWRVLAETAATARREKSILEILEVQ